MKRVLVCLKHLHGPCHCCQDAKAKRNDFPPATDTWADIPDRWNMDIQTIHGNRFATMVVIHKSRYGMSYLQKDKSASTVTEILEQAFAKA
eukprot:2730360-Rhodomonas_salina.2